MFVSTKHFSTKVIPRIEINFFSTWINNGSQNVMHNITSSSVQFYFNICLLKLVF